MLPSSWKNHLAERAARREAAGLQRRLREFGGDSRAVVECGGKRLISFGGNDYLGLAAHPLVREAAANAERELGVGSGASRLVTGTRDLHARLEADLARFRGMEAALVYTTGYQANVGVISALADAETLIFSDALNHASIIDGCRLSRATVRVFPHRDYDMLARDISNAPLDRLKLVVSDTLFSIEGDFADLQRLADLCRRHDALSVLDDAHGFGALGTRGNGVPEIAGLETKDFAIVTGTFSKALGSLGGYVCCSEEVRDHLVNVSRPFIYSTAGTLGQTAAALAALAIVGGAEGARLRERLRGNVQRLRRELATIGLETGGEAHIVPVRIGAEREALRLSAALEERGLLVPAIRPPTVPPGCSSLRISVSAAHEREHIESLSAALRALSR